jgi:hypothetical protein
MTTHLAVDEQLKRIGSDFRLWGKSECRELPKVLFANETILFALNGRYENGFALLVATDERLLLIDKKPLFLCFEDMRYEMISEVDYIQQLLTAQLSLRTPGRNLRFTSFRPDKVRALTTYIQERVTEVRKHDVERSEQPRSEPEQSNLQPDSDYYRRQFEQLVAQMQQESPQPEVPRPEQPMPVISQDTPQAYRPVRNPYSRIALSARRRVPKFSVPLVDNHEHFGGDDTTHVAQAH